MAEWEAKLRQACMLIDSVIDMVHEAVSDECQYDNAAHTGGLAEKLGIAKRFIEEELPKKNPTGEENAKAK